MRNITKEFLAPAKVSVTFEDGSVSFRILQEITLAALAEHLEKLGKWHLGPPLSVDVRFSSINTSNFEDVPVSSRISLPIAQTARDGMAIHGQAAPGRSSGAKMFGRTLLCADGAKNRRLRAC